MKQTLCYAMVTTQPCGKCKKGDLVATGGHTTVKNGSEYEHVCNNCGDTKVFLNQVFPSVDWVPVPAKEKEAVKKNEPVKAGA